MPIDQNGYNQLAPASPLSFTTSDIPNNIAGLGSEGQSTEQDSARILEQAAALVNKASSKPETPTVQDISPSLVDTSGRYPKQLIGYNNEDLYGQGQSWMSKAGNGVLKGLALAGTTFLDSTVGLIAGTYNAIADKNLSSFYDNPFTRSLDEVNKNLENQYLPNYYADKEKNASWYSPDHWLTANFLFDGVVKNLGMVAGTVASAAVFSGIMGALSNSTKLFSVGRAAEALTLSEEALATATMNGATTEAIGALQQGFRSALSSYNTTTTAQRAVVSGLTALGQSGIMAAQSASIVKDQLINEFKNNRGYEPYGEDLKSIEDRAHSAGNVSYLLNTGLFMASNYIQLPRVLASSAKLDKAAVEALGGGMNKVTFNPTTGLYEKAVAATGIKGWLARRAANARVVFSPSEAIENSVQGISGRAVEAYYGKKNNKTGNDALAAIVQSAKETAGSSTGIDEFFIGGLAGGIVEGVIPAIKGKLTKTETGGIIGERRERARRTEQFLDADKEGVRNIVGPDAINPLAFTKEAANSIKRAVGIQEVREQHLAEGDIYESKNDELDYAVNFLVPKVKYGLYNDLKSNLTEILGEASTPEGFSRLQAEGKAASMDTREAYVNRLNKMIQLGEHLNDAYRALNIKYKNQVEVDPTTGKPKLDENGLTIPRYSDDVINKMAYAGARIADFDIRATEIQNSLTNLGLESSKFLDFNTRIPVDEEANNISEYFERNVNQNDRLNIDQKEEASDLFFDSSRLRHDRESAIAEYFDIASNPEKYREVPETISEPNTETVQVGQSEQPIATDLVGEDGTTLRINTKNEDGTFNITDAGGNVRNVTASELEGLNLFDPNITQNSNKEFFSGNAGQDYGLRMGNQEIIGRLHYDQATDKLSFEYKEGDRTVRVPASKELFQGENPLIQPVTPLSEARQRYLDAYTASEGPGMVSEDTFNVLADVQTDYSKSLEKLNKSLTTKRKQLSDIQAKLHAAQTTMDRTGHVKGLRPKSNKADLTNTLRAANHLADLQRTTETEIANLESQKNRLLFHQEYVAAQLNSEETYPLFRDRFLKQQQITDDLIISNGEKAGALVKLRDSIHNTIDKVQAKIRHILSLFTNAYGQDKPYSKLMIDELRNNPEFMRGNPGFEKDIKSLEDRLSNIDDVEVKPSQKILNDTFQSMDDLQAELAGIEEIYNPINDIANKIKEYKDFVEAEEASIKKGQDDVAPTEETLTPEEQEKAVVVADTEAEAEEVSPEIVEDIVAGGGKKETLKKKLSILFKSTTQNTSEARTNPDQKRHNTYLQRIRRGAIEGQLRYIEVHKGNEMALGLEGLTERQLSSNNFAPKNQDEQPIFRVYIKTEGGKKFFVDAQGNNLTEVGTKAPLDQIIYGTKVGPSLTFGGEGFQGETRYSHGTEEQAAAAQEAYRKERAEVLDDNTTYREGDFKVSRGQAEKDGFAKSVTENLITKEVLDSQQQVVFVAEHSGFHTLANGDKVHLEQGQVYLDHGDMYQVLNIKQSGVKDANVAYNSLLKIAELKVNKGDASEINKIQNALAGRMYIRDTGDKHAPTQLTITGDKLWIGRNSIDLTPEGLRANEKMVKDFVKRAAFNVNNELLKANEPFSAIESTKSGEPVYTDYPSYQHYLLSSENGRSGPSLPLSTEIKAGDDAFRGTYSYTVGEPSIVRITEGTPSNITNNDIPDINIPECNG